MSEKHFRNLYARFAVYAASGEGGPVLVMPILTLLGIPAHMAVGISLFDSIFIALPAVAGYLQAAKRKEIYILLPVLLIAHGHFIKKKWCRYQKNTISSFFDTIINYLKNQQKSDDFLSYMDFRSGFRMEDLKYQKLYHLHFPWSRLPVRLSHLSLPGDWNYNQQYQPFLKLHVCEGYEPGALIRII